MLRPRPVTQEPIVEAHEFERLFLDDVPLLDVRAPAEFARGALPCATNVPLLDDEERRRVGIRYKEAGQEAAIALGHELVSGPVKAARVAAWRRFAERHPEGALYCFRGGLRSRTAADWLRAAGAELPRVSGGYKALRRFLIDALEQRARSLPLLVLGGRTGTGKTRILQRLARSIDLEGRARHRGSAFGTRVAAQPAPVDFEHALAVDLLKLASASAAHEAVVEDESRNIGRLHLPAALHARMAASPLVLVEAGLEARVSLTLQDYVVAGLEEHVAAYGTEPGFETFAAYLRGALGRIRKRLGGKRYDELAAMLETALAHQRRGGDVTGHRAWIRALLVEYYDPMYDHQLARKRSRVAFAGSPWEVEAWLAERVGRKA